MARSRTNSDPVQRGSSLIAIEDLAIEDLAIEDLAIEDLAIEDLAIEDLAIEDLAIEDPAKRGSSATLDTKRASVNGRSAPLASYLLETS